MNYLKDRNSYITVRGEPAKITKKNIFEQKIEENKRYKTYMCWCGESFGYIDEIKQHRKKTKHFANRPKNFLNNE